MKRMGRPRVSWRFPGCFWLLCALLAAALLPMGPVAAAPGAADLAAASSPPAAPDRQTIPLHEGWNWFSFAVAPALPTAGADPTPTRYFRDYFGAATLDGAAAPVGAVVEAFNPRGDLVGSATVAREGYHGYMRVYGEEPMASPPTPGMREGETLTFRVNGYPAATIPAPAAWHDGYEPARVDLAAAYTLPVAEALASLTSPDGSPLYDYVLGEGFGGQGATYAPDTPHLNTLTRLEPGKGYFLRMAESADLALQGRRLPAGRPLDLEAGWRWIGYLPTVAEGLPDALASIDGRYDYLLGETGT